MDRNRTNTAIQPSAVETGVRNTMNITTTEHRAVTEAASGLAEAAMMSGSAKSGGRASARGSPWPLGLHRSFIAAAERDLLSLLNHRLGGAGVHHGARNP